MKKYLKNILCLFTLTVLTVTAGVAQVLPAVQSSFSQYNLNALQEKIFVHTDKSAYSAGELIWFKIYDVDAMGHRPLDLSKVVYVDILDNNQNAVMQAKIAMKNGTGSGSIYIPVTLTTGNFLLRAYTNWMKNFSPDYYFHKKLTIINPLRSPDAQAKVVAAPVYDIQFFPEGGNLVNGISSVIGVKATDQFGKGVTYKGVILDKNNDTLARFEPFKFGIGHFEFKPDNQTEYHAVIKIGSKTIEKELPQINADGYVMNVKDNGGQLTITVNSNMPDGSIYLFAHTRGSIKTIQTANTSNGAAQFSISRAQLGDGISQLTVFNSNRQPVCERLVFNPPAKGLTINASADEPQYNTRKKVNISIDAKDGSDKPVVADLSLSVYRIDSLQHSAEEDIRNYLLLSSDLKGNIESPAYYFNNSDVKADEAMDNLMLTQGWRRFNWANVLQNKAPAFDFLPEFNGPIINAKITNTVTNNTDKGVIAYLAIPGKRVQLYTAESDSLGRLIFNMKDFYGQGEIVVQTKNDTIHHIDILSPFSEQYAHITVPHFSLTPGLEKTIEEKNLDIQVQNIYNGLKMRQFYDPNVDSSAYFGHPYKTYLLDNYTRFTTMEEVMREYVSEVNIVLSKNHYTIKTLNENGFLDVQDPMVLIDGIPFFDADKLFATDPLKIYKLEDVPFNYCWGPSFQAGIFSFTSYKGDLAGDEIDPHAVVIDYDGLEVQRQFYSPQYNTEAAANSRIPDFRDVLYWAPYVITETQGKNNVSFYTSDKTGQYIGVIQGLTANGEAGSSSFMFNVVK